MSKPTIAITIGDPAGVGPETIVRAWADLRMHEMCRPIAVGQPEFFRMAARLVGFSGEVVEITDPEEAASEDTASRIDRIVCVAAGSPDSLDIEPAHIDARGGQAAHDALRLACDWAMAGRVDAITTAPLHKKALNLAGHSFPGHTEMLADFCGAKEVAMMLYLEGGLIGPDSSGLGVVHVTLHTSVRHALEMLDEETIFSRTELIDAALTRLHGKRPRLAVCALNPHAGEEGLFGDEEQRIIRPAVGRACERGILATGPLPCDTLFMRACGGEFDGVVAMLHDQGHIPLKLLGMHSAVNITLGLPIIRTSVAHGTAFDRAWQGTAESSGMIAAVRVAAKMAGQKECR